MGLSYKDAVAIAAAGGDANEYVDRFISSVKSASLSGISAAVSMDDALVVSMVLCRLLATPEGRKLMGCPKGKNTKYKAKDFRLNSPQRAVVIQYLQGALQEKDALKRFGETFADPPDDRTLKKLFDELVMHQNDFARGCAEMLIAAGACDRPGSQKEAADEIMKNLGCSRVVAK